MVVKVELCLDLTTPRQCGQSPDTFNTAFPLSPPSCYSAAAVAAFRSHEPHRRDTFNVLCLGLQGAGKSTLLGNTARRGTGGHSTNERSRRRRWVRPLALIVRSSILEGEMLLRSSIFLINLLVDTASR